MTATLRDFVERMPAALARRPRDERGYPIPWFTSIVDGVPDFRYVDPGKAQEAVQLQCCWVCGGTHRERCAFVIGPMCAINRTSAEPPSHVECAIYSARACPFLARPQMERPSRRSTPPDGEQIPTPGIMIDRNPGVALVWITRRPVYNVPSRLFDIGEPERVLFYAHSRKATRAEVLASIEGGLPLLREVAEVDGPEALAALDRQLADAMALLPAA